MSSNHDNSRTSGSGRRRSGGFLNDSLSKRNNLYEILELTKGATDDDIKRSYRRLALKYHPDKNQNNEECNKKFQEINFANSVLSNPSKRRIYDDYGEMGLKMVDQFGEERVNIMLKPWLKWLICSLMVLTCGCFGCCCCCCFCFQCCCNFCCGKCKPKDMEDYTFDVPNDTEEPVATQPQQSATINGMQQQQQFAGGSSTNFTIIERGDNIEVSCAFDPPPPYSPPNTGSPLSAMSSSSRAQTNPVQNYGATE